MSDFFDASKPIEYMQLASAFVGTTTAIVALIYTLMNKKGITQVQIAVDGKWAATMAQVAAQEEKLVALQAKLDAVQSASDTAKGKLEGAANEKANPT